MNIIGHQKQQIYFEELLAKQKISHAYLFKGIKGIGKFSFALELAKRLLIDADDSESLAMINAGSHPDLFILQADKLLGVKEIVPLYDFLAKKSIIAPTKLAIIDNAELLSPEAQNKLLKATEEINDAILIFVADNSFKILPALKSRLLRIEFKALNERQLTTLIEAQKLALKPELIGLATGSIGEYQALLDENYQQNIIKLNKLLKMLLSEAKLGDISILEKFKDRQDRLFYSLRSELLQAFRQGDLGLAELEQIKTDIDKTEQALARGQNYQLLSEALLFKIEEAKC